jgi:hypothetical protein
VAVDAQVDTLLAFVIPPEVQPGAHNLSVRAWGAATNSIIFELLPLIPGDVNGDGRVNLADLAQAAGFIMGRGELLGRARLAADCDNSGVVDVFDLVCMVDAAQKPGGRVAPEGLAWKDAVVWNAATHTLVLPDEATAVQWQGTGLGAAAGKTTAGALRIATPAAGLYGLVPRTGARSVVLPEGVAQVSEVIWGDARGRLFRARVAAPATPDRFDSVLNPQHGRLWLSIPVHRGRAGLEIFDVNGRRLGARELAENETGALDWSVPTGTPDGLYFVRYSASDGSRNIKILFVR